MRNVAHDVGEDAFSQTFVLHVDALGHYKLGCNSIWRAFAEYGTLMVPKGSNEDCKGVVAWDTLKGQKFSDNPPLDEG